MSKPQRHPTSNQKIIPITVSYGDGEGPVIMEHILSILQAAEARISINSIDIGENFYKREHYNGIPDSAWKTITAHPVILMAPSAKPKGDEYRELQQTLCSALELHTIIAPLSHTPHHSVLVGRNESAFQRNLAYRLQDNTLEEIRLFTDKQTGNLIRHALTCANIMQKEHIFTATYSPTALSAHRLKEQAEAVLMHQQKINYHEYTGTLAEFMSTESEEDCVVISQENGLLNSIKLMQDAHRRGIGYLGENYILFSSTSHKASFEGQLHAAILMLIFLGQQDVATNLHLAWDRALHENPTVPTESHDNFATAVLAALSTIKEEKPDSIYSPLPNVEGAIERKETKGNTKQLIGVELTLSLDGEYTFDSSHDVATILEEACKELNLQPQLMATRGFTIWPSSENYPFNNNDYLTIRFLSNATPKAVSTDEIHLLLERLSQASIIASATRHLYLYGEHVGFSI